MTNNAVQKMCLIILSENIWSVFGPFENGSFLKLGHNMTNSHSTVKYLLNNNNLKFYLKFIVI